jgi:hypothetical protein
MPTYLDDDGNEVRAPYLDESGALIGGDPAARDDPFGYKRTGEGLVKGVGETVANLGRLAQRGMAAGGIRTGEPIPERLEALEVTPDQEFAKTVGKVGATLPLGAGGGLGASVARGAVGGAMMGGDVESASLGAAGGAALRGSTALVGKVRELVAAMKSNPSLRKALVSAAEQLPLGIGGQVRQTRKFLGAADNVRKKLGTPAAAKTVTGGEKAAAITSPKRLAEAEFKEKLVESRAGVPLDEMTPELVQRQGVALAEKRINAALSKGDIKSARAILEKVNKEHGAKLNLRDLVKGKKK